MTFYGPALTIAYVLFWTARTFPITARPAVPYQVRILGDFIQKVLVGGGPVVVGFQSKAGPDRIRKCAENHIDIPSLVIVPYEERNADGRD